MRRLMSNTIQTMKRYRQEEQHNCVASFTRSKRPKLMGPLPPQTRNMYYVSATHTRNYTRNDSLVDYLNQYKSGKKRQYKKLGSGSGGVNGGCNSFKRFIMEKGNQFESDLVSYIHNNKVPVTYVSDRINAESIAKTIELMKEGVPVIHSAPVANSQSRTHGIIDLLVRSDYLSLIVEDDPLPSDKKFLKAPNLNGDYHYVVIDVKFSTLPLRADGTHLLNSGSFPCYKVQTWIYNEAIGRIQGYTPDYAYIMGRRWRYTKNGETYYGRRCLDKLGVIDFSTVDSSYSQRAIDAVQWCKDLRKFGHTWTVNPPSRDELYPNMCVDSGEWNTTKATIAENISDVTSIWYCGINHREKLRSQGIESWKDPLCTSTAMGITGARGDTIDAILNINRQDVDKIRPTTIINEKYDWKNSDVCEVFVDFETFTDVFSDTVPRQRKTDHIFMIGVYYCHDNAWKYISFIADSSDDKGEFDVMNDFTMFMALLENPKMWYWHAEPSIWNRSYKRHMTYAYSENWQLGEWCDLAKIFRDEPIVIKGCYKYGLKDVAKAMRSHGMITARIESECGSGLDAAVRAWQVYESTDDPASNHVIKDIEKYNEFDVKVLHEMITYIRLHHQ